MSTYGRFCVSPEVCPRCWDSRYVNGTRIVLWNEYTDRMAKQMTVCDLQRYTNILNKESERGAVLVAATMIEDLLGSTILEFLVDHKAIERLVTEFNAPLGTFSARILAAFALGLLTEQEYRDCESIRKVRNLFAHNIHTSFENQNVKDLCSSLRTSTQNEPIDASLTVRERYTRGASILVVSLMLSSRIVHERRLKTEGLAVSVVFDGGSNA